MYLPVVLRVKANGAQSFEPVAVFDQTLNRFVARAIDLGPAGERVFLILFGTGFQHRSSLENITVAANGNSLPVSFAGAQGSLAGLDQLNVELLPVLRGRGDVTLQGLMDGRQTNQVTIKVM